MRLFIAVPIAAIAAREISVECAAIEASVPGLRWVSPGHMHLTMKFLGERPDHDVARLTNAMRDAVAPIAPFDASTGEAGAFPNFSRPRVVWLGMEPSASFAAIAERLEHQIAPLGYPREERDFTAHLTLGRIARPLAQLQRERLRAALALAFDGAARRWRVPVNEVVLFSSEQVRGALRYVPLHSIPLGAR